MSTMWQYLPQLSFICQLSNRITTKIFLFSILSALIRNYSNILTVIFFHRRDTILSTYKGFDDPLNVMIRK